MQSLFGKLSLSLSHPQRAEIKQGIYAALMCTRHITNWENKCKGNKQLTPTHFLSKLFSKKPPETLPPKMLKTTVLVLALLFCVANCGPLFDGEKSDKIDVQGNRFCLTCCGPPPCCGYCGMAVAVIDPQGSHNSQPDSVLSIDPQGSHNSQPDRVHYQNRFCLTCCGPPPCCSYCRWSVEIGMLFSVPMYQRVQ